MTAGIFATCLFVFEVLFIEIKELTRLTYLIKTFIPTQNECLGLTHNFRKSNNTSNLTDLGFFQIQLKQF